MIDFFNSKPPPPSSSTAAAPGGASSGSSRSGSSSPHPSAVRATTKDGSRSISSASLTRKLVSSKGSPLSSASSPANANGAARPKPKQASSAVVVTTVKKRVIPPPSSTSHSSSHVSTTTSTNGGAKNALSEERRRRIAEDRERIEREKWRKELEQKEDAKRETKRRKLAAGSDNKSRSSTPQQRPNGKSKSRSAANSDDEESSALSSDSDAGSSRKRKSGTTRSKGSRAGSQSVTGSPDGYKRLGREGVTAHYAVPRDSLVETRPFEEACRERGCTTKFVSSVELVEISGISKYGTFFRDLESDEVTLEYPSLGASEQFKLVCPKSNDEYDPISDLLRAVYAMAAAYFTREQREEHFGSLDDLETGSTAGQHLTAKQLEGAAKVGVLRSSTPSLSREGSVALIRSPSVSAAPLAPSAAAAAAAGTEGEGEASHVAAKNGVASSVAHAFGTPNGISSGTDSPRPESSVGSPMTTSVALGPAPSTSATSILRSFTKARNRRDGPLFLHTLQRFNDKMRELKEAGVIQKNLKEHMAKKGVPEDVWKVIQEQCYARTVGPRVEELSRYTAFSDNVYGELLPRFMSEIAQLTKLNSKSVLLDLGSGVGNLLIQAALQTGCKALGCEMMSIPSDLAELQLKEARTRWAMWSLQGGQMDSWKGDFCDDAKVREALCEADVVLVNNYAFLPKTNDSLSLQFLDLKDGAHIVSLKPFVPPDFRLTARTLSSPLAILRVDERMYTTGCVSWADRSGKYYIQTVDRSLLRRFHERSSSVGDTDVSKKKFRTIRDSDDDD